MADVKYKADIILIFSGDFEPVSFDFTISSGTSPCTGTIQVLVKQGMDESKWPPIFDVRISDKEAGSAIVFNELRTVEIKKPYTSNPLDEKELWQVSFEDNRWRLAHAKIYGMYNGMKEIFGNKWQWDKETLDKDRKPWTYKTLVENFLKMNGLEYNWSFETGGTQVRAKFSMKSRIVNLKVAKKRAHLQPLNKKWEGKSLAEVLAELLREIKHTVSIDFDGKLVLTPIDLDYEFKNLDYITANSHRGNKKKTDPDWVLVVGSRVRDQIKIMPDMKKFNAAFGSNLETKEGVAKAMEQGFIDDSFEARLSKLSRKKVALEPSDMGLEPCCPDITGRIYNIWDLAKHWDVNLSEASVVYQHRYGVTDWETFLSGNKINQKKEEGENDNEYRRRVAKETVKAERDSRGKLTPSEKEYLQNRKDISVFYSKLRIIMTYFFRLFRLPEEVKVNYLWDEEQIKIRSYLVPNAPIGTEIVPREYILPIMEYLNEPQFKFEEPYVIKGEIKKKRLPSGEEAGGDGNAEQDSLTERENADLLKDGPHTELRSGEEPELVKKTEVLEGDKPSEIDKPEIPKEMPLRERVRLRVWTLNHKKISRGHFGSWTHFTLEPRAEDQLPKIDNERGLFLFDKTPWITASDAPWSEYNPVYARIAPVGVELCYERKDPKLGILNYYVHIVKENKTNRFREYRWYHYETIDDLVEMLKDGFTLNRKVLNKICSDFEPESQLPLSVHADSVEFAAIVPEVPGGTLHSVNWTVSPSGVFTRFEINSGFDPAIKDSFIKKIKNELEARKLSVPHRTWNLFQKRRGQFDLLNAHQHVGSGSDNDERRVIYNAAHKGPVCLYDPLEEDDVSFCTGQLTIPKLHKHDLTWVGPLLCREPIGSPPVLYNATWVPVFGHNWWAENGADLCPYNHEHSVGGFYQPHVYIPPEAFGIPEIIKNPVKDEETLFPQIVWLADEGATDSKEKGEKFPDRLSEPALREKENWRANPRTVPRDSDGNTAQAGILVEYCVPDAILADTSAVFYIDWQLTAEGESFSSAEAVSFRSGSGSYVLPVNVGAAFEKRIYQLFPIGVPGTLRDYDSFAANAERGYDDDEDLYRGTVYLVAVKWVYGYTVSVPQQATASPVW